MAEDQSFPPVVFSIGHGNRGIAEFLALLGASGIDCLIDVRAYPSSKRYPQFTRIALEPALRAASIRYLWEGAALGGMRSPAAGSPHAALSDPALRGYADHMSSAAFQGGLGRLCAVAALRKTVFMCAEREPAHCHRSFIADALQIHGMRVLHIQNAGDIRPHTWRPEARLLPPDGIVYDAGVQLGFAM